MSDKEPKRITTEREALMGELAGRMIDHMAEDYPEAREIDLLNAFIREFTRRAPTTEEGVR